VSLESPSRESDPGESESVPSMQRDRVEGEKNEFPSFSSAPLLQIDAVPHTVVKLILIRSREPFPLNWRDIN
jgi:hypothetical protein